MTWYVYEIDVTASILSGMRTIDEWKAKLAVEESPASAELVDIELEVALDSARSAGWSRSVGQDPYVFMLPNQGDFQFGFVFSLSNQSKTIVLSPLSLPWLNAMYVADC